MIRLFKCYFTVRHDTTRNVLMATNLPDFEAAQRLNQDTNKNALSLSKKRVFDWKVFNIKSCRNINHALLVDLSNSLQTHFQQVIF